MNGVEDTIAELEKESLSVEEYQDTLAKFEVTNTITDLNEIYRNLPCMYFFPQTLSGNVVALVIYISDSVRYLLPDLFKNSVFQVS